MKIEIAVPTYRRSAVIFNKTLKSIIEAGGSLDNVTVFLSDKNERSLYEDQIGGLVKIVDGVIGIAAQRRFIVDYYPDNTNILMIDDDIKRICVKRGDKLVQGNINKIAEDGFTTCRENGFTMWGIYAASNPYFMKERVTSGLFYIIASFFGVVNTKSAAHLVYQDEKEDYIRSLQVFREDGGVVRLEYATVESNYYTEPGGLQVERTKERVKKATEDIVATYPDHCSAYVRKSTGMHELKMNNSKFKTKIIRENA